MNIQKIKFLSIAVGLIFLLNAKILFASSICGDLWHPNGPFDYTDPNITHTLKMVEAHHFTRQVEQLIGGESTAFIGGDLAFILAVFPNHHRALNAMSRLSLRDKTPKPEGARYSALCYFDRAVRFKPNDAMVRSIYSNHLLRINKVDLALEQLLFAVDIEPENPTIHYNLGLLYLKKKDYDKAVYFAKKAYAQDFPLPGLKKQLIALGKWR
ncbi:tetratricopeptide repeat protein [Nitrosomonas aestuarii]|uniref:tetratricopeptide repeat protein n=1 Tax=Nitrosomonas aestuarii TaxID=52441 RepID=UPI000D4953B5|nr:tetratricopeptide repeat protein [Nitrosomonas aestuarii]PTN12340.1 TPR repeat protein [Nitrosomonas aestuarii]